MKRNEWCRLKNRWSAFNFSHESISTRKNLYGKHPGAVNSEGCIYWNDSWPKVAHEMQVIFCGKYFSVRSQSTDIGSNDNIYTLQRLADTHGVNKEVRYSRLLVKNKVCESEVGLPSTQPDTCWVMRVVENKIVSCNCHGKVFIFTLDIPGRLSTECLLSLPEFDGSHEKPGYFEERTDVFMCVTNKREVIIATRNGKKLYICSITDDGQIEPIIQLPLEENGTEYRVCGLAFDPTHEEDIVILRSISGGRRSSKEINIYSRNGKLQDFSCVFERDKSYLTLLSSLISNSEGIVAIVRVTCYIFSFSLDRTYNLVGQVCNETRRFADEI